MPCSRLARVACLAFALSLLLPALALARDPGRWQLSGYSSVPFTYWQGVTGDRTRLFFDGVFEGLYKTTNGADEHILGWYTHDQVKDGIATLKSNGTLAKIAGKYSIPVGTVK